MQVDDFSARCRTHASRTGQALYALVDSRQISLPALYRERSRWAGSAILWNEQTPQAVIDLAPRLVEIGPRIDTKEPLRRLRVLLGGAQAAPYGLLWAWSAHSLESIAEHLQAYAEYTIEPTGKSYYLHYCDARVFERLMRVWAVQKRERFLAPFAEVWSPLRTGEMQTHSGKNALPSEPCERPAVNAVEHEQLIALGRSDRLVLAFRTTYPELLADRSYERLYFEVEALCRRAEHWKIGNEGDLQEFCRIGLFAGPSFDEQEQVAERLHIARRGEIAMKNALSEIAVAIGGDA